MVGVGVYCIFVLYVVHSKAIVDAGILYTYMYMYVCIDQLIDN
jgi:hypothetical protein